MSTFAVRRAGSSEEIKSIMIGLGEKEGWIFGKHDHQIIFDADPTGHFIGELDGRPISCISVVKHGNSFAFIGLYIVDKEYRGKGFGLKTFQAGMASLEQEDYTCGLCAMPGKEHLYEKCGFKKYAEVKRCEITASERLQSATLPEGITIKPINDVSFDQVSKYDSYASGMPHDAYLHSLLSSPEHYGFVALNDTNNIVGLIVLRKATDEKWIVAPLYANNIDIAKYLLKVAMERCPTNDAITMEGCTAEIYTSIDGLSGQFSLTLMFNKFPAPDQTCVYVLASITVG